MSAMSYVTTYTRVGYNNVRRELCDDLYKCGL